MYADSAAADAAAVAAAVVVAAAPAVLAAVAVCSCCCMRAFISSSCFCNSAVCRQAFPNKFSLQKSYILYFQKNRSQDMFISDN